MGSSHHKEHTTQANAFLVGIIALLLIVIYGFTDAIQETADSIFNLTRSDLTMIPVGAAAFGFFWLVMDKALFKPVIKLIEERESLTTGAEVSAASAKEQTAELEAEYDEKLTKARVEGMQIKAKNLSAARDKAQVLVDAASKEAMDEVAVARAEVKRESEELREQLMQESQQLIDAVVTKVTEAPEPVKEVNH